MKNTKNTIPSYAILIEATYQALKELGGSGKNSEINAKAVEILQLSNEVLSIPHLNSSNCTEIDYRLAWARTLLKKHGALENSTRSVWSITTSYTNVSNVNGNIIEKNRKNKNASHNVSASIEDQMVASGIEIPEEVRPWRKQLHDILLNMNPYSFERLSQRLLRECGFEDVNVTKKSGDGGVDGIGKLKINGIFSFNIAFQCKRYKGSVGAAEIRDFRGSLTTDIEKAVFITTGSFSKPAIAEANTPGKQQIDLMDGEAFISKLAEYNIGVHEIKDYEFDENYYAKI